MNLVIKT